MDARRSRTAIAALVLAATAVAGPAAALPGPAQPGRTSSTGTTTGTAAALSPAASRHVGVWAAQRTGQSRVQALTALETGMGATAPLVTDYLAWDEPFPDGLGRTAGRRGSAMMLMIKLKRLDGSRPLWADLAAAAAGTSLDADLDRWAASFKAYPGLLYVTFHKEPNEPANAANGTAPDFRKAYRAFVHHMRAAGVTNVRYVWAVPTTLFSGSPPAANRWYPGDDVVDVIGATGANRFGCDPGTSRTWRSFQQVFAAAHTWARQHPGHTFGAVEFETVEDPAAPGRKAAWLDAAHTLAGTAGWADLEVMSYFSSGASDGGGTCPWWLDTSPSSLAAAGRWMTDPLYGG